MAILCVYFNMMKFPDRILKDTTGKDKGAHIEGSSAPAR
jgi:hypothetical protein